MDKPAIGIIGTGSVGASVAISVLQRGVAGELLLYDLRRERAEGEAMDLAHGSPFYPAASVRASRAKEKAKAKEHSARLRAED